MRLNLFCCFSSFSSRERSKPCPPNFAPPFCALCLNVCDFLPKTWDLGRKEGKFALSGAPAPDSPKGTPFGAAASFLFALDTLRAKGNGVRPLSHLR